MAEIVREQYPLRNIVKAFLRKEVGYGELRVAVSPGVTTYTLMNLDKDSDFVASQRQMNWDVQVGNEDTALGFLTTEDLMALARDPRHHYATQDTVMREIAVRCRKEVQYLWHNREEDVDEIIIDGKLRIFAVTNHHPDGPVYHRGGEPEVAILAHSHYDVHFVDGWRWYCATLDLDALGALQAT